MAKKKKVFEGWKWDIVKVEVVENKEDKLELLFYGNIYPKKNSKRVFGHTVLPSENFIEWHKRCSNSLKGIEFNYNIFPCEILVQQIAHTQVKGDIDNCVTSLLDFMTDNNIIPDDNKFVVSKLTVLNAGYVKNLPITKVIISPLKEEQHNICINYQGKEISKTIADIYL